MTAGPARLDLAAIETRINDPADAGNLDFVGNSIRDIRALLAHVRALRAALDTLLTEECATRLARDPAEYCRNPTHLRAAEVLASCVDGPGAGGGVPK